MLASESVPEIRSAGHSIWLWFAVLFSIGFVPRELRAADPPEPSSAGSAYEMTGDFPEATPLTRPTVLWKFGAKPGDNDGAAAGSIGVSDPVVHDGVVYFGDDAGTVHALRASDGAILWQHRHGQRVFHPPFVDDDGVYCTSEGFGVVALNRKDGTPKWQTALKRPGAPLKVGPTVLVASGDGVVYAFDGATGSIKWEHDYLIDDFVDPPGFAQRRARFDDSPARPTQSSSDGRTFFQSVFDQCRVVAIDCETGLARGTFPTQGWIWGNSTANADFVLVGSQDKHCYCFAKRTGKLQWKFPTGSRIESGPAIRGDSVFIPSCDGKLYRIDLRTGQAIWTFQSTPDKPGNTAIYSAPLLLRDCVCFATADGQLYGVSFERGELLWKTRPLESSPMYSSPATDGRRIFVHVRRDHDGAGENAIVAIDQLMEP